MCIITTLPSDYFSHIQWSKYQPIRVQTTGFWPNSSDFGSIHRSCDFLVQQYEKMVQKKRDKI